MEKEASRNWVIARKVIDLLVLSTITVLTILFLVSPKICMQLAGVGNLFFLIWIVFGDPLKTGLGIKMKNKTFWEFALCAAVIWSFAVMFRIYGMCGTFTDMISVIGKMFPK